MSKFVIRNLENEKRRLEKQIKKIDKQIIKIKESTVLLKGETDLSNLITINESTLKLKDDKVQANMKFKTTFTRYENEVTCTMESGCGNKFVGVARCAVEDDFDVTVGMSLAEHRAIRNLYNHIIGLFN